MNIYRPYIVAGAAFVVLVGAGLYFHEQPIDLVRVSSEAIASFFAPCTSPLPYTIGTIDPRFSLTRAQVVAKLADGAGLWNSAAGKSVLVYAPDNPQAMPINFVYDVRQQTVELGKSIDSTEASQSAERSSLDAAQRHYVSAQQSYGSAVADFNSASASYSTEVQRVNAAGGADKETYARLQSEQASLKSQQSDLRTEGAQLDAQATELKQKIDTYNARVKDINKVVTSFNSSASGDFEEGLFVRDANGKTHIDIYAYKNQSELLHSLAHELGHSLSLVHNQNPVSIMFPYNKDGVTLSTDDVAALKVACRLK